MAEEDGSRAKELFIQAHPLSPAEREAFLDRECEGNPKLRDEVDALFALDKKASDVFGDLDDDEDKDFATRTVDESRRRPEDVESREGAPIIRRFGRYELVRELGRGGMGIVYLADDPVLERRVALKALSPAMLSGEKGLARFEREVRAIAQLKHPRIVPIYDIGEAEGIPFFTMEYVEGLTIAELTQEVRDSGSTTSELDGQSLIDAGSRLLAKNDVSADNLFESFSANYVETICHIVIDVADALAHTHASGVIHRDIKPSNVLLRKDGRAQLFDFGLARLATEQTLTITGEFAGSPYYVSPEQVAAKRIGLDLRTDVYSLGVTLFELLTLSLPFVGETTQQVFRQILIKEPAPPRRLNPSIPRDLETICMTAMDKDPDRRYQSADELADDLRRFLSFQPIKARPMGLVTRTSRLIRRHRAASVAVLLGLLLVFGAPLGFAWIQLHARQEIESERNLARAAEEKAVRQKRLAEDALEKAETERERARQAQKEEEAARLEADRAREEAVAARKDADDERAAAVAAKEEEERQRAKAEREKDEKEQALRKAKGLSLVAQSGTLLESDPELALLLALEGSTWHPGLDANNALSKALAVQSRLDQNFRNGDTPILVAQFSENGSRLMTQNHTTADVWDVATGRLLTSFKFDWELTQVNASNNARLSPLGDRLLCTGTTRTNQWENGRYQVLSSTTLKLVDIDSSLNLLNQVFDGFEVHSLAFDHSGDRILINGLWEAYLSREDLSGFEKIRRSRFSPDTVSILGAARRDRVELLNLSDLSTRVEYPRTRLDNTLFDADGSSLLSVDADGEATLWSTAKKKKLLTLVEPLEPKLGMAFSDDERLLIAVTQNGQELCAFDLSSGLRQRRLATLSPNKNAVFDVSTHERLLALSHGDDNGLLVDIESGETIMAWKEPGREITSVQFTPDGKGLLTLAKEDSSARLRSIEVSKGSNSWQLETGPIVEARFSIDGSTLLTRDQAGELVAWDTKAKSELFRLSLSRTKSTRLSTDGQKILVDRVGRGSRVYDIAKREWIFTHSKEQETNRLAPNGSTLFTSDDSGSMAIVRLDDPASSSVGLGGHTQAVVSASFDSRSSRLVTASRDRTALVHDLSSRVTSPLVLGPHPRGVRFALFSPDDRTVATAAFLTPFVFLWDAQTGERIATIKTLGRQIETLRFSRDSRRLYVVSKDSRELQVLDADEAQVVFSLVHQDPIVRVNESLDSRRIVTADSEGAVSIWDSETGLRVGTHAADGQVRAVSFSTDGRQVFALESSGQLKVWVVGSPRPFETLKANSDVQALSVTPDGRYLVSYEKDGALTVRSALTGSSIWTRNATCFDVHPPSSKVAVGDRHGLHLLDMGSGIVERTAKPSPDTEAIQLLRFARDAPRLATVDASNRIQVWSLKSGLRKLAGINGGDLPLVALAMSPDGSFVVGSYTDGHTRVWGAINGNLHTRLEGHQGAVRSVDFAPDGRWIATTSDDGTARLWDVRRRLAPRVLAGHQGGVSMLSFSADGQRMWTVSDDATAVLWDRESDAPKTVLRGHRAAILSSSLSHDDRFLATTSEDGTVRVWDTANGHEILTLQEHEMETTCVAFTPDGNYLISGSRDDTIRSWPVDVVRAANVAKRRDLSPAERDRFELTETVEDR